MKFKRDPVDGRLLCPECGAPLYATLDAWLGDVPVFTDPEQSLGLDCWDHGEAPLRETVLAMLYCHLCEFKMPGDDFDEGMIQTRRIAE